MTRKVFYSFQYKPDSWRVSMVRNIGAIEDNKPANDNDWETITKGGDISIKKWINNQMIGRSCTVVLIGEDTANRKWINYEIIQSWDKNKGIVGIYIHGVKNRKGEISNKGNNPFSYIKYGNTTKKLSDIVKCYNPQGTSSKDRYDWIKKNLQAMIEEAIAIRNKN